MKHLPTAFADLLRCLPLLLLWSANAGQAALSPAPSWEASCQLPSGEAGLRFVSVSGDAYEDDMRVNWRQGGHERDLPLRPGLYHPITANVGGSRQPPGICEGVAAFAVGDALLMLLALDWRPGPARATLLLLDPARNEVLDLREAVADIPECETAACIQVRRAGGGLAVRLMPDNPGAAVAGWLEINASQGKLSTRWLELTD